MSDVQVGSEWISPKVSAGYTLAEEVSVDTAREFETRVAFPRAFAAAPHVALSLASIDLSDNFECALRLVRVDAAGFDVAVCTAHRSIVYGVQLAWIAYANAAADSRFQSGTVVKCATDADLAPLAAGTGRRLASLAGVRFPVAFASDVKVFVGISALAGAADLKLSVRVAKLDRAAFDLALAAWGDTALQRLSVSWFAYPAALETATRDFRLLSGVAKFANDQPGFLLHAGAGPRLFDLPLALDAPKPKATKPPTVIAALTGLGANAADADVRLKTSVAVASPRAATLTVGTWADTKIDSGMAMWLACFELPRSKPAGASSKSAPKRPAVAKSSAAAGADSASSSGSSDEAKAVTPEAKKSKVAAPKKTKKSAAAATASTADPAKDDDDNDDDGDDDDGGKECKICFDAKIDAVFVPCGHQCACHACATLLASAKGKALCPICTAKIGMVVKTFIA
jgi:hypothetical protein